jgi:hypothetical protein
MGNSFYRKRGPTAQWGGGGVMDTSEQYVNMCEKASKDLHDPPVGLVNNDLQVVNRQTLWARRYRISDVYFTWMESRTFDDQIPLYAQDQLQRIYKRDNNILDLMETQAEFDNFCTSWDLTTMLDSFEQIWLAFVMKERFGKTWDGNEWQKGHNQGTPPERPTE